MRYIVKSVHEDWGHCVRARKALSWLFDSCGFIVLAPREGVLIVSKDDLILEIYFHSYEVHEVALSGIDFLLHGKQPIAEHRFPRILGKLETSKKGIIVKIKDGKKFEFKVPKEEHIREIE